MKRLFALFCVLFLISSFALAEEEIEITGEWYGAILYSDNCLPAVLNESGAFVVETQDGEVTFSESAIIYPDQEIDVSRCWLSEFAALYYETQGHSLYGKLFLKQDDAWKYFSIDDSRMCLFLNGNITPFETGESIPYLLSGNQLFMTESSRYTRGTVTMHGSMAFVYELDADPYMPTFGGTTYNWGRPFYLFVRTSIGK